MTKQTQTRAAKPVADGEKPRRGITLKPTQVLATALASVTAAFLGSRLGVAGTVVGAGVASLVSTLGTALYQTSLDRTSKHVRKVAVAARTTAKRGTLGDSGSPTVLAPPSARPGVDRTRVIQPGAVPAPRTQPAPIDPTRRVDAPTEVTGAWAPTRRFQPVRRPDPIADANTEWLSKPSSLFSQPTEVAKRPTGVFRRPAPNGANQPTELIGRNELVSPPPPRRRFRPKLWVLIGVTVLAFVLGMGVVTAIELLDNRPFSGGTSGTTIGSLFGQSTQSPATSHPLTPQTGNEAPNSTNNPAVPPPQSSRSTAPTTTTPPTTTTTPPTTTTTPPTTTTTPTAPAASTGKPGAP